MYRIFEENFLHYVAPLTPDRFRGQLTLDAECGFGRHLYWPRLQVYARYPFEVCVANWFDRLSAPIRFYYSPDQLVRWCHNHALTDGHISPTGLYGWRVYGQRPGEPSPESPVAGGARSGMSEG